MPINTANATWLGGDDVETRLCDCPKFVPWHRGPAEYNPTTTNLLLPSHFEGVWGIPPAAGGKQELSNLESLVPGHKLPHLADSSHTKGYYQDF